MKPLENSMIVEAEILGFPETRVDCIRTRPVSPRRSTTRTRPTEAGPQRSRPNWTNRDELVEAGAVETEMIEARPHFYSSTVANLMPGSRWYGF